MNLRVFFLLLLYITAGRNLNATTVYVDAGNLSSVQNGQAWVTAYTSLAVAIQSAATNLSIDSILVAKGNYFPEYFAATSTNPTAKSFVIRRNNLAIIGGYAPGGGTRNSLQYPSRLNGNIGMTTQVSDHVNHVMILMGSSFTPIDSTVVLDGLIIENGNASGVSTDSDLNFNGSFLSKSVGGGLVLRYASPRIYNCRFSHNKATTSGGAISMENSNARMVNCIIQNNQAGYGSGIRLDVSTLDIRHSILTGNNGHNNGNIGGGGIYASLSHLKIAHCVFTENYNGIGGAIYVGGILNGVPSSAVLSDVDLINNTGTSGGGLHSNNAVVTMDRCRISGNKAQFPVGLHGGGIYAIGGKVTLRNCLLSGNYCLNYGSAIRSNFTILNLSNCTVASNYGNGGAIRHEGSTVSINNSIVYGNDANIVDDISNFNQSIQNVNYSLVSGGFIGTGNSSGDPLFIAAPSYLLAPVASGNFRVSALSTAINTGHNDSVPAGSTTDLAGNPRIFNGTVDRGAYEHGVFLPIVNLGNNAVLCQDDTLWLDAGNDGAIYLWNTGDTSKTLAVTAPGNYWVSVSNPLGTASDSIQVYASALTPLNLGADTAICPGGSVLLQAQNFAQHYLWSNNATSSSITVSAAGTYHATVSDDHGCAMTDTIQISVFVPQTDLGADTGFCTGNVVTLDAQHSGGSYLWNTGAISQTIIVDTAGTYFVTTKDTNQCMSSDTVSVLEYAMPVVYLGNDTLLPYGTTLTLDAGNPGCSYLWNTGSGSQTIVVNSAGTYDVIVTSPFGCPGADSIVVTFEEEEEVSITGISAEACAITLSPNPAKNETTLFINNTTLLGKNFRLTDVRGTLITTIKAAQKVTAVSLSGLAPGLYLLHLPDRKVLKLIKQ